ncbi:glycosyltransferase family 2 protein [Eubacterium ramulus]|uniref:glycosyltransferase family 2 protein n=1 Tax=Eubacterium ramulus TaxID=39490 RepID=UPI0022E0D01E|nr:glycosyltransferase family 2 protein [Eubacterium ramulus]
MFNKNLTQDCVTIIVPCYNGKKFIEQCFGAILNQTYKNIETIFVDDGSNDDSFVIAKEWEEKFLNRGMKLICLKKENGGAASAINNAFSYLSSEYFEVLDVDDYIYPQNIEIKMQFLKEHPEVMFVRNNGEIFNVEKGQVVSTFCVRDDEKSTYNIFRDLLYGRTYNWTGTYLIRTESFIKMNKGLEIYNSRYGQNMQLLLPVAYYSECGFVPEVLTRYNEYPNSISHDSRYDRNLELLGGYEDIRVNVLKHLGIITENQLEQIKQFYLRQKMMLAANFKKKDAVTEFYRKLTHKKKKDILIYLRVKYPLVDVGFKMLVRIMVS